MSCITSLQDKENSEFSLPNNGLYEAARRRKSLQSSLARWRNKEGLTTAQVALRMGIKEATLIRIEKNIDQASFNTLARYAIACGIKHYDFDF